MCLIHPQTPPNPRSLEKTFHKVSPGCQKGWGLLPWRICFIVEKNLKDPLS